MSGADDSRRNAFCNSKSRQVFRKYEGAITPPPLLGGTLVAGSNLVHIADTWFGPTAVITHSLATVRVSVLACFLRCSGGVRLGKWISQLTALSLLHRGNTGAALETPEDGHNLITAATHTHTPVTVEPHTLYIYKCIYLYVMFS